MTTRRSVSRSRRVAQGQVCRHDRVHVAAKEQADAANRGGRADVGDEQLYRPLRACAAGGDAAGRSRSTGASKEGPRSDGRADGPHGARDGGDTVLNLVVASGYLSSLMGNPRVSRYLDRRHPEILTEFKVIVAATSWPANSPWVAGLEGHSLSRLAHPARRNKKRRIAFSARLHGVGKHCCPR